MDDGPGDIAPDPLMGVDAKEALTQRDEARNVQNRIWCELVKLHTVHKKKSTKKLMDRKRETTEEKLGNITRKPC